MTSGSFRAFHDGGLLADYLATKRAAMAQRILREREDYLLNVGETAYVDSLVEEFTVTPPRLDFAAVFSEPRDVEVPLSPETQHRAGGQAGKMRTTAYAFFLPVTSDPGLLRYTPSPHLIWAPALFIEQGCIGFAVISDTPEELAREYQKIVDNLQTQIDYLTREIDAANTRLRGEATRLFQARKHELLKRHQMLGALNIPLRKTDPPAQTFAIPTPALKQPVHLRPTVTAAGFTPEPTLPPPIYHDILQTIHDVGRVLERHPALYRGRGEEELRDLLLFNLEPRYAYGATGETFNKGGKVDIFIRYEDKNAIVAECKFWDGQVRYLQTLDQLLGYLTWRDSKAAAVLFVPNKDISAVLRAIEQATPQHPNYLALVNQEAEGWYNYRFHLAGDPNREVRLAVLVFHLPPGDNIPAKPPRRAAGPDLAAPPDGD
jgi:hypothetical protein